MPINCIRRSPFKQKKEAWNTTLLEMDTKFAIFCNSLTSSSSRALDTSSDLPELLVVDAVKKFSRTSNPFGDLRSDRHRQVAGLQWARHHRAAGGWRW